MERHIFKGVGLLIKVHLEQVTDVIHITLSVFTLDHAHI